MTRGPTPKKIVNLTLPEELIQSLNSMVDKQNYELMKIVSHDQILHLMSLLRFYYFLPNKKIPNRQEID